ncbi:hypothetical protein I3W98_35035, partial [Streptomyces cavourensis]|nr:hypothetical protein [Streptomyces cavourensis]
MDPIQNATQWAERFRKRFASSGECLRHTAMDADRLRGAEASWKLKSLIRLGLSIRRHTNRS